MYFNLLILLAVTSTVIASDCQCNSEQDKKAVWSYLRSLSKQAEKSKDKSAFYVLPGVLSPLVGCDCQKARPKRKIMPDVEDPKPIEVLDEVKKPISHEKKIPSHIWETDPSCPVNYVRVGQFCFKESELLDYE